MRAKWTTPSIVIVLALGIAAAYVVWLRPPRVAIQRAEARERALRERLAAPWDVPAGLRPSRQQNLVPTQPRVHELRVRLDCPHDEAPWTRGQEVRPDTMGFWKVHGVPPAPLVRQLRREPALRAELRTLADGSYGQATDASGRELDEVLMWMVALAHADDERCLESIVDALRVARAIAPLLHETTDSEWADESLVLASLEERLVACSQAADPGTRARAAEVLVAHHAAQAWTTPPERLLREATRDLAALGAELEADLLAGTDPAWRARLTAVEAALDDIEWALDADGTSDESLPEPRRQLLAEIARMRGSTYWGRSELLLLAGVLRAHSGLDPTGTGQSWRLLVSDGAVVPAEMFAADCGEGLYDLRAPLLSYGAR